MVMSIRGSRILASSDSKVCVKRYETREGVQLWIMVGRTYRGRIIRYINSTPNQRLNWIIVPPIWANIKTRNNSTNFHQKLTPVMLATYCPVQSTIIAALPRIRVLNSATHQAILFLVFLHRIRQITRLIATVPPVWSKSTHPAVESLLHPPMAKQYRMVHLRVIPKTLRR